MYLNHGRTSIQNKWFYFYLHDYRELKWSKLLHFCLTKFPVSLKFWKGIFWRQVSKWIESQESKIRTFHVHKQFWLKKHTWIDKSWLNYRQTLFIWISFRFIQIVELNRNTFHSIVKNEIIYKYLLELNINL